MHLPIDKTSKACTLPARRFCASPMKRAFRNLSINPQVGAGPVACAPVPGYKSVQWRRERDSNPRCPFRHNGFQDRRYQPLTHPSAGKGTVFDCTSKRPLRHRLPWKQQGSHCGSPVLVRDAARVTICLPVHRPGRPRRRSCEAPPSFPPNEPQPSGSLFRHRQNRRPATRCFRRRPGPPVRLRD